MQYSPYLERIRQMRLLTPRPRLGFVRRPVRAVAAGGGADVGEQHRQEDQTVGSADQNDAQIHPDNAQCRN